VSDKRRPSASPVCYADEKDVARGYMWAEPEKKEPAAKKKKPKIVRKKRGQKR